MLVPTGAAAMKSDGVGDSVTSDDVIDGVVGGPRERQQMIIGVSANAETADKSAAMSAGMDHFIDKPIMVTQTPIRFDPLDDGCSQVDSLLKLIRDPLT